MKNETAKREIESLDYYLQNHTDDYSEESHTAMMMARDALEQEPCLDWYDVPSNEMTLEQARQAVKDLRKKLAEYLEQEPCEDAISRQAVLDTISEWIALGEYNYTNATEYLQKRIKAIPPVDKWIPVSEMPEEDGLYLVYTEEQPFVCPFEDGEFFIDEVIAWMPLPPCYEPQESEG